MPPTHDTRRSARLARRFEKVRQAFHQPETRHYQIVQGTVWGLIVASIVLLLLEPLFVLADGSTPGVLRVIEVGFLALFTLEYALRVATFTPPSLTVFRPGPLHSVSTHLIGRLRYALTPMMLIDLLALVALFPELRSLRAVRLLRLVRSVRLFRYNNPFTAVINALEENGLMFAFALSVLLVETLVAGVSLFLVERGVNPELTTLADGIWWALVTLTTVGFGDVTPISGLGRIVGAATMVAGMFTLALFAGLVGSSLVGAFLGIREEQFRMGEYVNHIVVCGYDKSTELLLELMAEEIDVASTKVVLFDDSERPPGCNSDFLWVQGDPTKQSELDKVRLTHAQAVIVVGSREKSPQAADANTILTVFTLRAYLRRHAPMVAERHRPLYIVAEILDSENVDHATTAGADEVIETRRLGFSMIAHTVRHHGTARTMSRVVLTGSTNVYIGRIPGGLAATESYGDLMQRLQLASRGCLVIGIRPPGGEERFNPTKDTQVVPGTDLIYLAEHEILDDAE